MKEQPLAPDIIQQVGFDFDWDNKKVWKLDLPVEEMSVKELEWHFDIPFWDEGGGQYNLKPRNVIDHPSDHTAEYDRTMKANITYPIDLMENKGRWLILDGLHRLVKAVIEGQQQVRVRKVPRGAIPEIEIKPSATNPYDRDHA